MDDTTLEGVQEFHYPDGGKVKTRHKIQSDGSTEKSRTG